MAGGMPPYPTPSASFAGNPARICFSNIFLQDGTRRSYLLLMTSCYLKRGHFSIRQQGARTIPYELNSRKNGDHGNDQFQLSGGNMASQRASKHNPRHSTGQELEENRRVDRAKLPMKCAADRCQHQAINQVCANYL